MNSAPIEQMIEEAEAALKTVSVPLEGLTDYARLNLQPPTHAVVQDQYVVYSRRAGLLTAVIDTANALLDALTVLEADGYPDLPLADISQAAFVDLENQRVTMAAAVATFYPPALTQGVTGVVSAERPTTT